MATASMIAAAKLALRRTTNKYDAEIERWLDAALLDLGIAGVVVPSEIDPLVEQACVTYALTKAAQQAGDPDERLQASYNEQKSQLASCTGYTDWLVE